MKFKFTFRIKLKQKGRAAFTFKGCTIQQQYKQRSHKKWCNKQETERSNTKKDTHRKCKHKKITNTNQNQKNHKSRLSEIGSWCRLAGGRWQLVAVPLLSVVLDAPPLSGRSCRLVVGRSGIQGQIEVLKMRFVNISAQVTMLTGKTTKRRKHEQQQQQ